MSRVSKQEIILRAEKYIEFMQNKINENKHSFIKYNKKIILDFEELLGYLSLFKYGKEEYQKMAFDYIRSIFE